MKTSLSKVKTVCDSINRRIYIMDYDKQSEVREYLEGIFCDSEQLMEFESDRLADLLDVNTNCIFDLLSDLDLVEEI
jgi:hypothetical protein